MTTIENYETNDLCDNVNSFNVNTSYSVFDNNDFTFSTPAPRKQGLSKYKSSMLAASFLNSSRILSSSSISINCDEDRELDIQSISSIEENEKGLKHEIKVLKEKVQLLEECRISTEKKYRNMKKENSNFVAKIHILEEQILEMNVRADERIQEERRRHSQQLKRIERENKLELENHSIRLERLEKLKIELEQENFNLKSSLDQSRSLSVQLERSISDLQLSHSNSKAFGTTFSDNSIDKEMRRVQNETYVRKIGGSLNDSGLQVLDNDEAVDNLVLKVAELELELSEVKKRSLCLEQSNQELQTQLLNREFTEGYSYMNNNELRRTSLAAELEDNVSRGLKEELEDQKLQNLQLQAYINGLLVNILNKDPTLLEIKTINHNDVLKK